MSILRRLAIAAFLMAAPLCQPAQAISLLNSGSGNLDIGGLRFTVTSCQVGVNTNGVNTHACVAGDNLVLDAGPGTTGNTIELRVIGASSSAALQETVTNANRRSDLIFGITVSQAPSSTSQAKDATFTANGVEKFTDCSGCTGNSATASAALTGGPGTLTADLVLQNQTVTQTTQNISSALTNFTTPTSSFTITETLRLVNTSDGLGGLRFNYAILTFHTTPEPATISVMLLGLGGLAFARRRRASRTIAA